MQGTVAVLCSAMMLAGQGVLVHAQPARVHDAQGKPTLKAVPVSGYRYAVAGQGWGSKSLLTFVFHQGDTSQRLRLWATRSGTFLVAARQADMCAGVVTVVHDSSAHRATLHGPALGCIGQTEPPAATLAVLKGKEIR